MTTVEWANLALCLWAMTSLGPTTSALWRSRGRATASGSATRDATTPLDRTDVLLVRPCAGDEPELSRTLCSMFQRDEGIRLHVRFAIAGESDPAMPAARQAVATLIARGIPAEIVLTQASGLNRKVEQIAAALADQPHARVIVADSDLDLSDFPVTRLLAPLADAHVFASWAPPLEGGARTPADHLSSAALDGSFQSFPFLRLDDRSTKVGKLFAFRRDMLPRIGHLESLVGHLGEDMEIARRAHADRLSVISVEVPTISRMSGRSTRDVLMRYSRWIQVVRAQRPWLLGSYPLFVFPLPLIVVAALALSRFGPTTASLAPVLIAVFARLSLFATARRLSRRSPLSWMALGRSLASDVLLLVAFARAISTRRLVWRGNVLELGPRGLLRPMKKLSLSPR